MNVTQDAVKLTVTSPAIVQAVPSIVDAVKKIADSPFAAATGKWKTTIEEARKDRKPLPSREEIISDLEKFTTDIILARAQADKLLRVRTEWKEAV